MVDIRQSSQLENVYKDPEEAEGENLAIAATFLKVAYLDYLSSFGDFISSKSYYASL